MAFEYIQSHDGSLTLYSAKYNEHYHSLREGALQESYKKHIFPAFACADIASAAHILDICFGLGYNVYSCLLYAQKYLPKTKLHITSVELDLPLIRSLVDFTYPQEFEEIYDFKKIQISLSSDLCYESEHLSIKIINQDAREAIANLTQSFDIMFQDPFSLNKTPLFWTTEYFQLIKQKMHPKTILTTYAKSSAILYTMSECGFVLYKNKEKKRTIGTLASLQFAEFADFLTIDMKNKLQIHPDLCMLHDKDFL